MLDGIYAALSAIRSGQFRLDSVANNLANVNTTGFRSSRVDLATGPGGQGVVVSSTSLDPSQGAFLSTSNGLDVAIEGSTFFEVQGPDGQSLYTRGGSFQLDGEGYLVTGDGYRVGPGIQVPQGASEVSITRDGRVVGQVDGESVEFGQLSSVNFANPQGLEAVGGGYYSATPASGDPVQGNFSTPGFGQLFPGGLEASNTDLIGNTLDLLLTQRFIQFQTGVIRAEDDILGEIVNLGRSRRS